jgi:hypothetical protein
MEQAVVAVPQLLVQIVDLILTKVETLVVELEALEDL